MAVKECLIRAMLDLPEDRAVALLEALEGPGEGHFSSISVTEAARIMGVHF